MKKLSLLTLTLALTVSFVNCQKRGFIPDAPNSASSKSISTPKDSVKNTKRSILKPDSLRKD